MKKSMIAALFALSLPLAVQAMPMGDPGRAGQCEMGMHKGMKHTGPHSLFKALDLSKEQRQQINQLMREQMGSAAQIHQRYLDKLPAADKQAMQDELQAKRDAHHKAIRDLLKPEQQAQFDEHLKAMEARRAERAEFEAWKAQKNQAE